MSTVNVLLRMSNLHVSQLLWQALEDEKQHAQGRDSACRESSIRECKVSIAAIAFRRVMTFLYVLLLSTARHDVNLILIQVHAAD